MKYSLSAIIATAGMASIAAGANIDVTGDITTSTTWTSNNVYNLTTQINVTNGATLTIEPGTLIASAPTANGSGSLAITRGSKIEAQGTRDEPIIFTSTNDDFTNWREACNEWGNITVMGRAYISNSFVPTNTATFGDNFSPMEGLVPDFPNDPNTIYGGTDDDDNSGTISYVSLRYGGRVVGLTNELNGMSLGGIGRGTQIDHVEIMNNVDDGIEIWGGTVNLSYVNIWNVGDDSFDIDQGWRGSAQFGLIVQGFSTDASQGSGVGDNMCETDGAENSDAQPVTTAQIANFTLVGQPLSGDGATAWRDGARVQYNQCIIMDCGEKVIRPDGDDGDGAAGYGHNGTLTMAQCFASPYNTSALATEPNAPSNRSVYYTAQVSGNLSQIADTVLYRNIASNAYDSYNDFNQGSNGNVNSKVMPIVALDRATNPNGTPDIVVRGGKQQWRVVNINPMPSASALTSNGANGENGFVYATDYRGAFAPNTNWLCGWSAADSFGMVANAGDCMDNPGGDVEEPCPADFNGDGNVTGADIGLFLAQWGSCSGCSGDFNNDGVVGGDDFGQLLAAFGTCP